MMVAALIIDEIEARTVARYLSRAAEDHAATAYAGPNIMNHHRPPRNAVTTASGFLAALRDPARHKYEAGERLRLARKLRRLGLAVAARRHLALAADARTRARSLS